MKGGVWPVTYSPCQAVLEWIDVAILNMTLIVRLVAYEVLPKSTLPNPAFASRRANGAEFFVLRQRSRKTILDEPPARGEIAVADWQAPDSVQMVGQNDERIHGKWMAFACCSNRLAQHVNMVNEEGL